MTSTTDPTVPLPTATDTDDDDDDDDVGSSLLPSQPPVATQPPAQPTVAPAPPAGTVIPGVPSAVPVPTSTLAPAPANPSASTGSALPSSATGLADNLPSSSPTTPANDNGGGGLSAGASAGIGVGVALLVCLAAFGVWFFLRRRRVQRTKTQSGSKLSSDEEHAPKAQKAEIYAYRAGGAAEVSGDEKQRRWSELDSPTYVAEAGEGQVFRAELPGSAVPVAATGKGANDRLFSDSPINEVDEPADVQERIVDKKDARLFSDPPIDEGTIDTLNSEPTALNRKG